MSMAEPVARREPDGGAAANSIQRPGAGAANSIQQPNAAAANSIQQRNAAAVGRADAPGWAAVEEPPQVPSEVGRLRPEDVSVPPHADAALVDPDAPIPVPAEVTMVASDLDGTLLDQHLLVGAHTRAALPRLVAAGIPFVLVTGRPPRWLAPVTDQIGTLGLAVCGNGSLVVDLTADRLVRATPIDRDLALSAAEHLRSAVPGITFALERLAPKADDCDLASMTVFGMEEAYNPLWGRPPDAEIADIATLIGRGEPLKLLAIPPADSVHDNDSLMDLALRAYAGRLHVTHSGARHALVEITASAADKGVGFLEVADALGIDPAGSVAVGDMPNDLPLLTAAGTGYAVANAHPALRNAADHVLPSNTDDGVGRLLEAILAARS